MWLSCVQAIVRIAQQSAKVWAMRLGVPMAPTAETVTMPRSLEQDGLLRGGRSPPTPSRIYIGIYEVYII